jgi:hypothetical protein
MTTLPRHHHVRGAVVLTATAFLGLAAVPTAANAYPVPGPDLCEVHLAHVLGQPGFDLSAHTTDPFFTTGPGRALLAQPPCSSTRSVPVPME